MTLWAEPGLYFFKSNIQNLATPLAPSDAELNEVSGKNRLLEILWLNFMKISNYLVHILSYDIFSKMPSQILRV